MTTLHALSEHANALRGQLTTRLEAARDVADFLEELDLGLSQLQGTIDRAITDGASDVDLRADIARLEVLAYEHDWPGPDQENLAKFIEGLLPAPAEEDDGPDQVHNEGSPPDTPDDPQIHEGSPHPPPQAPTDPGGSEISEGSPLPETYLDLKGNVILTFSGPHRVVYLDSEPLTRNEVVVHCTPETIVEADSPDGIVLYRVDEQGTNWDTMPQLVKRQVGGVVRTEVWDAWIYNPARHDHTKHRDPVRVILLVSSSVDEGTGDGSHATFARATARQYGTATQPRIPPLFMASHQVEQIPAVLDPEEIRRRAARPVGADYGKAFDKCVRDGDGIGSHERGHLSTFLERGSFLADAKDDPARHADFRMDCLANVVALVVRGVDFRDPQGRPVAEIVRGSLIDNSMRSLLIGLEGNRDQPFPSKLVGDDGYATNWRHRGRVWGYRLLRDSGLADQLLTPVDHGRIWIAFEQFARHVIHLYEQPGQEGERDRLVRLPNGELADRGMWRTGDLGVLLDIAAAIPDHPDADQWRELVLSSSPSRTGVLANVQRVSGLYGLFHHDPAKDVDTFMDSASYYASDITEPKMGAHAALDVRVCDLMGWAPPPHLPEFVRLGAEGNLRALRPAYDGRSGPHPCVSPFTPERLLPPGSDYAYKDRPLRSWHGASLALSDWTVAS